MLDITTTELADELVGGFLSAGPDAAHGRGRSAECRKWFRSARPTWSISTGRKACPRSFAAGSFTGTMPTSR